MGIITNISSSSFTDAELVIMYQRNGEQDVLARLYLRYSELVYGCCLKYLQDAETAKDAVMEIYQELVQKLKQHPVDNFKSWLYVVAKNYCLMQLRKNKRSPITELSADFMQSEDFSHLDNALEKEQQLVRLEDCIKALNMEQKETVQLFYLQGKCYNDISEITGYDWNKVRSLIQNGRRNLKMCMEQNG